MAKKMNYSYQVRKEIESLNSNITDEELFSSDAFAQYIEKALDVELAVNPVLKRRKIKKILFADKNDSTTAATNNEYVTSNMLSPFVRMAESREDKYYTNLGQIIHEGGHIWFTDFVAQSIWMDEFLNGTFNWWPRTPVNTNADDICDALNKFPNFRQYFFSVAKALWNIEEDAFIEYLLSTVFGGSFMHGIRVIRDNMQRTSADLDTMISRVHQGDENFSDIVIGVLLSVDFGYEIKIKNDGLIHNDPLYENLMKFLDDTKEYREALHTEKKGEKRFENINEMLCCLWDYLPRPQENQNQQGQGKEGQPENSEKQDSDSQPNDGDGSDDSNSENSESSPSNTGENKAEEGQSENNSGSQGTESTDFTETELQKLQKSMNEALDKMGGTTKMPTGNTRPVNMKQDESEALENSERNTINSQTGSKSDVDKAMKEVIESIATEKVDDIRNKDLNQEAKDIYNKKYPENGYLDWKYIIRRGSKYQSSYDSSYERVKQYSTPAKRQLERIFKIRKQEGKTRGYMTGTFDASSVYRTAYQNDGHNFTRRQEPDGDPDAVFALLIDESGSMVGKNMQAAKDTAVLLDDILSKFGISYMVVGHHTRGYDDCVLDVVKDFDEVDKTAKYRLGSLSAYDCNRDAAAISYCAERLLSQPEKKKVLIVISDGEPSASGFHPSISHIEDARLTVEEYSKKGVTIFGAVIDGRINNIKRIYGDKTMDLTELTSLPRTLSNLVKRYVIKR